MLLEWDACAGIQVYGGSYSGISCWTRGPVVWDAFVSIRFDGIRIGMDEERDIRKVKRDKLVEFLRHVEQDDEDESFQDGDGEEDDSRSKPSE